jgi:hypothetical protein
MMEEYGINFLANLKFYYLQGGSLLNKLFVFGQYQIEKTGRPRFTPRRKFFSPTLSAKRE